MLIQCTQCQTVYNFDDSTLQGSSIDVRCARCQSVFRVDAASAVSEEVCRVDESELAGMSFRSEDTVATAAAPSPVVEQAPESALFEPEPEQTFDAPEPSEHHQDLHPELVEVADAPEEEETFSFAPLDESPAPENDTFESLDDDTPEIPAFEKSSDHLSAPEDDTPQWDDSAEEFSFGDSDDSFSFDQASPAEEEDSFSWSDSTVTSGGQSPVAPPADESPDFIFEPLTRATEAPAPATPADFDEAAFAPQDSFAPQESLAPQDLFAPQDSLAPLEDELPPPAMEQPEPTPKKTPPSSRPMPAPARKTSKFLVFILFLLLLVAGVYGYFYATLGTTDVRVMIREIQQLINPGVQQPQGSLTINSTESFYIDNSTEGSLFVIQGTIRNDYPQARAELSVTATLYKGKGEAFTKKTVYCGNTLSRKDLESKTFQQLSEAMSNPFGTALVNLNVAPGGTLPFTVVFNQMSDDLSEFSIEPATSKAVSQ